MHDVIFNIYVLWLYLLTNQVHNIDVQYLKSKLNNIFFLQYWKMKYDKYIYS